MTSIFSCTSKKVNYDKSEISKNLEVNNFIIGQITVVGNEPFTELGIIVDDTTVYILDCNKKLKETLLKEQGQNYKIIVKEDIESNFEKKLSVIRAEKL